MNEFPPDIDQHLQAPSGPEGGAGSPPPEAAPTEAAPPPVGAPPEAAQEDPVVAAVRAALDVKYAVLLAYITYGDQLRCPERDGLYTHFQTHVEDERDWIYQLHRNLASRGEEHSPTGVSVPTCPRSNPRPVLEALLALETQALAAWGALFGSINAATDVGLSGFAQNGAQVQQSHVEDLKRWLGGVA